MTRRMTRPTTVKAAPATLPSLAARLARATALELDVAAWMANRPRAAANQTRAATRAPDPVTIVSGRAFVRRTVAALRLRHPELRGVPSLLGVLAVLAREGIHVLKRELPRGRYGMALLIPWPHTRFVYVNRDLPRAVELETLLHEFAHLTLGHLTPETVERQRREPPRPRNDPPTSLELQREAEAAMMAALLLGPERVAIARQQLAALELAA